MAETAADGTLQRAIIWYGQQPVALLDMITPPAPQPDPLRSFNAIDSANPDHNHQINIDTQTHTVTIQGSSHDGTYAIADKQWKAHADQTRFSYKSDTITLRGQFSHSGDQSGSLSVVENVDKTRTRLSYQLQTVITEQPQPEKQPVLYQVHCNQIGAPILLTDDSGNAVWSVQYNPFGNADIDNDVDGNGQSVPL